MLINNRIKMALSERKEEKIDISKLDGEVSPSKPKNKKKKERETHEVGEEMVVDSWHIKDQSRNMLRDAVDTEKSTLAYRFGRGIMGVDLVVRIVEKRRNGVGREEYKSRILDSYPSKKYGHHDWTQEKKDAIFLMIIEHQAK